MIFATAITLVAALFDCVSTVVIGSSKFWGDISVLLFGGVEPEGTKCMIAEGNVVFCDVRTESEYDEDCIPKAVSHNGDERAGLAYRS